MKENRIKFNRENILQAAEELFNSNGVERTTMDDIAKKAQYSKSTIYVYFKSKDEIYYNIVFKGMCYLENSITESFDKEKAFKENFLKLCNCFVEFKKKYPLYFKSVLSEIEVEKKHMEDMNILQDIYNKGEEINNIIAEFIKIGNERKEIECREIMPTVFLIWASISGIISMCYEKEQYIKMAMGMTKKEFLSYSFKSLIKLFN